MEAPPDLIRFYRALLADDPAQPVIAALLASALIDDGDPWAALAVVDAIGSAGDPALGVARGRALKALGRFEPAADAFADAVGHGADSAPIFVALANCLAEAGRLDEAAAWLERAAAKDDSGRALSNLAAVRARLGQEAEAIAAARAALCRDHDLIDAHRTLAVLLAHREPEAVARHQEASFGRQQVFAQGGAPGALQVLVLTCVAVASVPIGHLLPRSGYAITEWFIDHATEDAPELSSFDVIFNVIGEPDLMPVIVPAVERVLASEVYVLNPIGKIIATRRAELPRLLAGIPGVVVPDVAQTADADRAFAIGLPALVRPLGSHGGKGVRRVETQADLVEAMAGAQDAYVTKYVDYRSADGLFRKYRMIFVDRVAYPYHLAIGPEWMLHYWTAGMESDACRRDEEARFLVDPYAVLGSEARATIGAIGRRLDLDYAGIDFSILPDGRVLVFEANAAMLVHPERDVIFAYRNQAVEQILDAFAAMLRRRAGQISINSHC